MRVGLRFRWVALLITVSGVIPILLLHRNATTSNNSATAPSRRRVKDVPVSVPRRRKGRRRNREISNSSNGNHAVASHGAEILTRNEYEDNGDDDGSNETNILRRHPSRIPGYVSGSNATYFGYVMRDIASRVLSRHIVGSGADVLIVSKDLPPRQQSRPLQDAYSLDMKSNRSVGPSFLRHSIAEGHRVHGIGVGDTANDVSSQLSLWWESFSASRPPSWILLAVFDPPIGSEDALLSSPAVSRIISGCTVTYIVFRVSSTWPRGSKAIVRGKDAVDALVGHGYKVSVLSSSHSIDLFEPNSLLDGDSLSRFLLLGANKARQSSAGRSGVFNAYLFATQGLDLAIPSQREYVTPLGAGRTKVDKSSGEVLLSLKSCKAEARVEFRPAREGKGIYRNEESAASPSRVFLDYFEIFCGNSAVTDPSALTETWMSAETPDLSEAVCVRINGCGTREKGASACNTRILPLKEGRLTPYANTSMPNLLVVMIDPISRPLFRQSLPKTRQLLIDAGFTAFDNYTAVGDNSGPNQAALYSGQALSTRQDISSQDKRKFRWIWDDLRDAGYATYKAEDGCIRNSNMVQSIGPRTSHGSVIHEMSCFDFERPNCIGGQEAARHLTSHATQFIDRYSQAGRPWSAFISFIDSHEDTHMLAATLDDPLHSFLSEMVPRFLDNTLIAVLSDHGLHYSTYLESLRGKKDRAQPVLFLKVPDHADAASRALQANKHMWTTPFDVHATFRHFLFGSANYSAATSSLLTQLSQDRRVCNGSEAIPKRFCDLFQPNQHGQDDELAEMVSPAAMLSYYADIPADAKQQKEACPAGNPPSAHALYKGSFDMGCRCSTSHRSWYDCNQQHPWHGSSQIKAFQPHEYFAFVDCPNRTLYMETRVEKDPAIIKRKKKSKNKPPPNIVFIEVDSVSVAYADRHLPKTREFLNKHRIQKNDNDEYFCESGICAADFRFFSVTGPNSITNQLSTLAGCVTTHRNEQCTAVNRNRVCTDATKIEHGLKQHALFRDASVWCTADSNAKQTGSSPWLFDVARQCGYVTSFAEEFCFEGSPFVTQGNVFQLNADIEVHKAHCRLAERYSKNQNIEIQSKKLWKGKSDFHSPCIDGTAGASKVEIPFEHITQMMDTYANATMPRFVFLNAMAAHDYSPRWEAMALGAEAYDGILLRFLKEMLSKPDAPETVFVLRSDHGLQDGPSIVDFSTQLEHSRPWTQIIVPQSLEGISLEALSTNQNRLASGFDLYRMLRSLIESNPQSFTPSLPAWSINVLATEIPKARTCLDGRIPLELCRNELEKTFIAPSYGTCNKFDPTLRFFCPKSSGEGIKLKLPVAGETDIGPKDEKMKPGRRKGRERNKGKNRRKSLLSAKSESKQAADGGAGSSSATLSCDLSSVGLPATLKSVWSELDNVVSTFPKAEVSGGIFLYPRQQALLTNIVRELASAMMRSHGRKLRICETGFGAGHSAAMFLAASNDTMVLSFDKFDRPYQRPICKLLNQTYPHRLLVVEGNSCKTVPNTLSARWNPEEVPAGIRDSDAMYQCDLLHGSSLCNKDNLHLAKFSPRGAVLTSTSMNSLLDNEVYFGPKAQWTKLREDDCIHNITCFEEEEISLDREFVFSRRARGSTIQHKFCVGVVSGACSMKDTEGTLDRRRHSSDAQPLNDLTETIQLSHACSDYQVDVPRPLSVL